MSLLPEFIIQQTLVRGFRAFREDANLVRMLFRDTEQRDLDEVVKFFRNKTIDICLNYPDKDLVIPSIVILLGSETESDSLLGELQMGAESFREAAPLPRDELAGAQTVLGGGSISTVGGPAAAGDLLLVPTAATGATSNTITAPPSTTILIDPHDENEVFVVTLEGTGAGQRREVVSITPSLSGGDVIVEVDPVWTVDPDTTTIFKIVGARKEHGTGEPSQLYAAGENIERKGQIYEARYRLDIIAYPQELTVYMYSMVKAIFTIAHQELLAQGLYWFSLGGTDLGPVPEFYPQLAYRRSMNLSFKYAFDVFVEMSQEVATQLRLALSVHDPDVGDFNDVERVVFETSFDTSPEEEEEEEEEIPAILFSMSGTPFNAPRVVANALVDADITWTGPSGDFTGKSPNVASFTGGGDFELRVSDWGQVQIIDFERGGGATPYVVTVTSLDPSALYDVPLTALQNFNTRNNIDLVADLSDWDRLFNGNLFRVMAAGQIGGPASKVTGNVTNWDLASRTDAFAVTLGSPLVVGDISGANWIPAQSVRFLTIPPSVTGDITSWTFIPTACTIFNNPSLTGDVSGFDMGSTPGVNTLEWRLTPGLFGDSSGWVFASSGFRPGRIRLSGTQIGGDISQWGGDFSILTNCWMTGCPFRYLSSGWVATVTVSCGFLFNSTTSLTQPEVDQILADARASEVANPGLMSSLQLQGTIVPSAAGLADAAYLISQGWTVITTP